MQLYFIPLGLILICWGIIFAIIFKKFPQLAHLDVNNLPAEKEARRKKQIMSQRIDEQSKTLQKAWLKKLEPFRKMWKIFQLKFRVYVGRVERIWRHEQVKSFSESIPVEGNEVEKKENKFHILLQEAESASLAGDFEKAEELFIAAIKIDQSSPQAYRGLADTYFARGAMEEAEQTYLFLHHLNQEDDRVLVKLGDIAESKGNLEQAIEYYQQAVIANDSASKNFFHLAELFLKIKQPQIAKEALVAAVEIEPKNAKYLDLLVEVAVLCHDKILATKTLNDLRLLNPANPRLETFKSNIERIK
jgi:tetratricopeptide (TPR) repeat protein